MSKRCMSSLKGKMSSFENCEIITKTSSRREHVTGIHGCAKLEIRLASLARTKWIRAITKQAQQRECLPPTLVFALFSKCKTRLFPSQTINASNAEA